MSNPQSRVLRELGERFRAIEGARSETRSVLDVLEREVESLLDAHRARSRGE
jgi:hypothetical protein